MSMKVARNKSSSFCTTARKTAFPKSSGESKLGRASRASLVRGEIKMERRDSATKQWNKENDLLKCDIMCKYFPFSG